MSLPPDIPAPDPATTRRENLTHEASVRSIGLLYYLGAGIMLLTVVASLSEGPLLSSALFAAFFVVYIIVGRWLRALNPKAKIPATILAIFGLLAFPIGTLINGYILYLLHSAKGKRVFTPEYQAVVTATPDIKYRTSLVTWICLGILVLVLIAIVFAAFSAGNV